MSRGCTEGCTARCTTTGTPRATRPLLARGESSILAAQGRARAFDEFCRHGQDARGDRTALPEQGGVGGGTGTSWVPSRARKGRKERITVRSQDDRATQIQFALHNRRPLSLARKPRYKFTNPPEENDDARQVQRSAWHFCPVTSVWEGWSKGGRGARLGALMHPRTLAKRHASGVC